MLPLTQGLGQYIARPGFDAVPVDVAPRLRDAFLDTMACLLGGRAEPVTLAAKRFVAHRIGATGRSRVLLGDAWSDAGSAAFVNAVAAHALDFDDMALAGHPSVVLVPALLAAGHDAAADGSQLLRAYLVGYEVWAELARREPDALHGKGWHPTGVLGTVAAAAAVAALRGLDAGRAAHALGIAASLAGGIVGNFGSMTKPLHAGWAARHGIEAADLASHGVTAAADVLEGPAGFLRALSPSGRADREAVRTEQRALAFRASGLSIKKYPVCYAGQRAIDGVLDLRRQHALTASDVAEIAVTVSSVNAKVLSFHAPVDATQARFSIEFMCANALIFGRVGNADLQPAHLAHAGLRALMSKVTLGEVDAGCPIEPGFALHDRVTIRLVSGDVVDSGPIRFARGHAQLPLGDGELRTKLLDGVQPAERESALRLAQSVDTMDSRGGTFDPAIGG